MCVHPPAPTRPLQRNHPVKESTAVTLNICRTLYILRSYEIHHVLNYLVDDKAVRVHKIPRSGGRRELQSNSLGAHGTSLALAEPQNPSTVSCLAQYLTSQTLSIKVQLPPAHFQEQGTNYFAEKPISLLDCSLRFSKYGANIYSL